MSEKEVKMVKNNNILVWILIVVVVCLVGYIVYTDFIINDQEVKDEVDVKDEVKEVSEETKNELKKILGISDGIVHFSGYSMQSMFLDYVGKVADFSQDNKVALIHMYAMDNEMLIRVPGSEYEWCIAGSGTCSGISKSIYKNIAKLYGIEDDFDSLHQNLHKYKDLYLYTYGGTTSNSFIAHEADYSYDGADIKVVVDSTIASAEDYSIVEKTKTYIFKFDNNNYYLYSIS